MLSLEKYKENLKTLGKFEKKETIMKGYLFSTSAIGYADSGRHYCSKYIYHGNEFFYNNFLHTMQGFQQSWLSFQRLHSSERLAGSVSDSLTSPGIRWGYGHVRPNARRKIPSHLYVESSYYCTHTPFLWVHVYHHVQVSNAQRAESRIICMYYNLEGPYRAEALGKV